jgi:outer membrane protein OmpA-like peptidoglycan-associated protein
MAAVVAAASATLAGRQTAPKIPLCPGLTIVTAVSQPDGDYESIKTIESVGRDEVRLKYSSEARVSDLFSTTSEVRRTVVNRTMLVRDLESADTYQQKFFEKSAETIPGTTSIGTSAAVLRRLKTAGTASLAISNAYGGLELKSDRAATPNYYQYLQRGTLTRAAVTTTPVILNDAVVDLPVVRATGDFVGDKAEFLFLNDERNPLALAFRMGIGALAPLTPDEIKYCDSMVKAGMTPDQLPARLHCDRPQGGDRDAVRVIKIVTRCTDGQDAAGPGGGGGSGQLPAGGGSAGGASGANALERELQDTGRADIYSIYFSFNSHVIRDESEPTLRDIAEVMRRHPTWRLTVNGHTDSIGGDPYNLALSERRAASVKAALAKGFGIEPNRLLTAGLGRAQPKDTNDTVEGRARNRRVELVRQ